MEYAGFVLLFYFPLLVLKGIDFTAGYFSFFNVFPGFQGRLRRVCGGASEAARLTPGVPGRWAWSISVANSEFGLVLAGQLDRK